MQINRRGFLKATAGLATIGAASMFMPKANALGAIKGTVIDYAAGVPSAASIKNAGHLGAVRYVSQRRPGTESWMIGKPVTLAETRSFEQNGLKTASVYQYGKAETADWKNGAAGAATHAPQAIALHVAAGGPKNRPIYVAIDDNPSWSEYTNQIRPYLQAFNVALSAAGYQLGVYGNYNVIDWAIADGLGEFFWMHNWGSEGKIHPRTTIHQIRIDKDNLEGVGIDMNNVYADDWGQWTPDNAVDDVFPTIPGNSNTGTGTGIDADTINQVIKILGTLSS
ncbi:glycoside hydrolase domain-containing protein [Corynebacterium glutamicum]|uniref:Tat pathway signal sequence domain protein n=2 Tax=Corynebacterium glutamicum TaxID=1718 RepID=A0AB36I4I0_CORGT|nr:DUF1906 domain-containing protein [Corynebacterium glutamicum]AGN18603.1 hypothetical protein C624_05090 [Corynebacterium glutamicum SCgG1]AGN21626.1 hypothetical protein C629_05090 [Corynebacterium glutamicum SCgG2]EGV39264.1 hypothetical protein CgS9114_13715 [Corynebacterium glutamicum S9114]EPP41225.1 hypothetical protein A583_04605 [Corynebacterium glutamicum Z188]NII87922.1 hypothetical protein [Corynebacterium glutamicum]